MSARARRGALRVRRAATLGLVPASARGLARDALLAGAGSAATRLFLLGLGILVSRTVGDLHAFGLFSSVMLTVQLVAMLAGLGLAQAAAQAIAAAAGDRALQDRTVRSMLLVVLLASALAGGVLLGAVVLLPGGTVARLVAPELALGATALLVVQLAAAGIEGVLRGLRRFRLLCVAGCVASVTGVALALPLVRHDGVRGGILAAACFLALQAVLLLLPLAPRLRGALLPRAELLRVLGVGAAPSFVNGLAWNAGMLVPPLLLVQAAGGLRELALWNAASQVRTIVSFAAVVVANAAIPRLSASFGSAGWRRDVATSVAASSAAALVAYLPLLAAARPLMGLYGPEYAAHASLLVVVASFVLLQVLGSALFVVLLSARRAWESALLNVVWAGVLLVVAPRAIVAGGASALAWTYLWTYGPVLVVLALLVLRVLRDASPAHESEGVGTDLAAGLSRPTLARRAR